MNKLISVSICIFLSVLMVILAVACNSSANDDPAVDTTDRVTDSDVTSDTLPAEEDTTKSPIISDTVPEPVTEPPVTTPPETEPPTTEPPTTEPPVTTPPVVKPPKPTTDTNPPTPQKPQSLSIDFPALKKKNADIYAWIDIPGTRISYPVLQRIGDDTYYHRRNDRGQNSVSGCLYTESTYNGRDFNDPVTVIYGHNMASGVMFGTLRQEYSSLQGLKDHPEIVIYMPGCEYHYRVFAAVPFDNRHILYSHDFSSERTFRLFFKSIKGIRELGASVAQDVPVAYGDKVIILSTCTSTTDTSDQHRFLVCAKLTEVVEK